AWHVVLLDHVHQRQAEQILVEGARFLGVAAAPCEVVQAVHRPGGSGGGHASLSEDAVSGSVLRRQDRRERPAQLRSQTMTANASGYELPEYEFVAPPELAN